MHHKTLLHSYSKVFFSINSAQKICYNILLLIALLDIVTSITSPIAIINLKNDNFEYNVNDKPPLLISKAKIKRLLNILNTQRLVY